MKKLTINDATKDELIQYFFVPEGMGGGYKIPAPEDSFLLWLQKKRGGELLTAYEQSSEAMRKSLHEYLEFVKQAIDEPDIDKKIELLNKANDAWERYEKANKLREKNGERMMEGYEV